MSTSETDDFRSSPGSPPGRLQYSIDVIISHTRQAHTEKSDFVFPPFYFYYFGGAIDRDDTIQSQLLPGHSRFYFVLLQLWRLQPMCVCVRESL